MDLVISLMYKPKSWLTSAVDIYPALVHSLIRRVLLNILPLHFDIALLVFFIFWKLLVPSLKKRLTFYCYKYVMVK